MLCVEYIIYTEDGEVLVRFNDDEGGAACIGAGRNHDWDTTCLTMKRVEDLRDKLNECLDNFRLTKAGGLGINAPSRREKPR
jgi:hypothetical protein